jgi:hypothetical protein
MVGGQRGFEPLGVGGALYGSATDSAGHNGASPGGLEESADAFRVLTALRFIHPNAPAQCSQGADGRRVTWLFHLAGEVAADYGHSPLHPNLNRHWVEILELLDLHDGTTRVRPTPRLRRKSTDGPG